MILTNPIGRRGLLASAGLLGAGAVLGGCAAQTASTRSAGSVTGSVPGTRRLNQIGIQLYTVRDLYRADPVSTLKMLAKTGYNLLEYAAIPDLPISAGECRKIANDLGIQIPSAGFMPDDWFKDINKIIDQIGVLEPKYALIGWITPENRTMPGLMKQVEAWNGFGQKTKKAGANLLYHNHDFEFGKVDGDKTIQDVLLQNTDPNYVNFEMDMHWVVHGGADIIDFLTRYPGRFKTCHIKDRTADGKMVNVGEGVINWKTAIAKASEVGVEYYFVEHDDPVPPVELAVAKSYTYLRDLRF